MRARAHQLFPRGFIFLIRELFEAFDKFRPRLCKYLFFLPREQLILLLGVRPGLNYGGSFIKRVATTNLDALSTKRERSSR